MILPYYLKPEYPELVLPPVIDSSRNPINGRFIKGRPSFNKGRKWTEYMNEEQLKVAYARWEKNRTHAGNMNLGGWNKKPIIAMRGHQYFVYDSSCDAGRRLGINARNIRYCAERKRNHAGGLKWFYLDDINIKRLRQTHYRKEFKQNKK